MAVVTFDQRHRFIDKGEDVGLAARVAVPHVVVDRSDALLAVLGRSEKIIVVNLIDFYHLMAAVGAFPRPIAPIFHGQQQRQCHRQRYAQACERDDQQRSAPVFKRCVLIVG